MEMTSIPVRRGDHFITDAGTSLGDVHYDIVGWESGHSSDFYSNVRNFSSRSLRSQSQIDKTIFGFSRISMPIIRQVFQPLCANDIVSVQPMSLPVGKLFQLDYDYVRDGPGSNDPDADDEG